MTARVAATCSSTLTPPRQTGRMPPTRRSNVSFQRRSKVLGPLPMNHGRGSAGRGPETTSGAIPPPGGGAAAGGAACGGQADRAEAEDEEPAGAEEQAGEQAEPPVGGPAEPLQALLRPRPKTGRQRLRALRQLRRFVPATEDPHHLADDDAPRGAALRRVPGFRRPGRPDVSTTGTDAHAVDSRHQCG